MNCKQGINFSRKPLSILQVGSIDTDILIFKGIIPLDILWINIYNIVNRYYSLFIKDKSVESNSKYHAFFKCCILIYRDISGIMFCDQSLRFISYMWKQLFEDNKFLLKYWQPLFRTNFRLKSNILPHIRRL